MKVTVDPAEVELWFDYVRNNAVIVSGGAPKVVCPLCSVDHICCQFTAGSLKCVRSGCTNPHHN